MNTDEPRPRNGAWRALDHRRPSPLRVPARFRDVTAQKPAPAAVVGSALSLREQFDKEISGNSRFREAHPSGKAFAIGGAK